MENLFFDLMEFLHGSPGSRESVFRRPGLHETNQDLFRNNLYRLCRLFLNRS